MSLHHRCNKTPASGICKAETSLLCVLNVFNKFPITQIDNVSFLKKKKQKQANHCAYFNPATQMEALNKKNLMNLWCCSIADTCMIFAPTSVHVKCKERETLFPYSFNHGRISLVGRAPESGRL